MGDVKIEFVGKDGSIIVLKDGWLLDEGIIVDVFFMFVKVLVIFFVGFIEDIKVDGIMFLFYMKVIMMKVFDFIIFGYVVKVWFGLVWDVYGEVIFVVGGFLNFGLGDVFVVIDMLDNVDVIKVEIVVLDCLFMYMVDSDKGIINLYVLFDVIIDVFMFVVICVGGKGWDEVGNKGDINCVILDCCYFIVYDEIINFFKVNGVLDVIKVGVVVNVGLMV